METNVERMLHDAVDGVGDFSAPSTTKFRDVGAVIAQALDVDHDDVYVAAVSKPGNLSVRLTQSVRATSARVAVAVLYEDVDVEATLSSASRMVSEGRPPHVLLVCPDEETGQWRVLHAVVPGGSELSVRLRQFGDPEVLSVQGARARPRTPVVMGARTQRMLNSAVKTAQFVVLIGPPGTGKSTLVSTILDKMRDSPAELGLAGSHEALWGTPDESWTTRQLVGGESIGGEGQIVFKPGVFLRAVESDRSLVLDELNRADMDRVLGPLLTFLGGHDVSLGLSGPSEGTRELWLIHGSESYSEMRDREVDGVRRREYVVGTDFRIIGTYNGLDAHQVYRLGSALGRRFRQIPIAPVDVPTFSRLLDTPLSHVQASEQEDVRDTLTALYDHHLRAFGETISPASFLEIPLMTGASRDGVVSLRLTEAYVASVGGWLTRQDPELRDEMGRDIVSAGVLTEEDWNWAIQQIRFLA
ncbi:AAA family ATPase [Euzebya pacifica]|uniref:AAA family ATPase n=1 Tax=Euzebya pacifica TaxID=1608957 RepID=UPI0030F5111A